MDFGIFHSWEILSHTVAIKHCDRSIFLHSGSRIPIETRWFWNVEGLKYPDKKRLSLIYQGSTYKSYIELDKKNRTRIFWRGDLGAVIHQQYPIIEKFPSLRFEKKDANTFVITFLNIEEISSDSNDNLESVVPVSAGNREGKPTLRYVTTYERNPKNREDAIKIHGTTCMCCGFNFEKWYGIHGKDFIEVHHIVPLAESEEEIEVNPATDLVCLCSNCHRMIHRKKNAILKVEELKEILKKNKLI